MLKIFVLIALFAFHLNAESWGRINVDIEGGFSAVLSNQYQSGKTGTLFNFSKEGKEDFLFPNWRAAVGLNIHKRHDVEFTYQPIFLDTVANAQQDLSFDNFKIDKGLTFQARYYFPFYRASYFYHLIEKPSMYWSLGLGLQMRSVNITFLNQSKNTAFVQTNIGPVPLITTRFRYDFENKLFLGFDAAGWWSAIPIANGSVKETTGWIYDVGLRGGICARDFLDVYVSMRLIGGGAKGDGSMRESGESYTYNTLNVLNFTTGFVFKI